MQRGNDLQQTSIFKVWFRQGSGLIDEGRLNFAEKASGANAVTCVECNPAQQSYAPKLSSVAALHESLSWVGRAFRDLVCVVYDHAMPYYRSAMVLKHVFVHVVRHSSQNLFCSFLTGLRVITLAASIFAPAK